MKQGGHPTQYQKHGFRSFERLSPQKISQRAFVRNMPLSVLFTPGEMVDLQVIANVWDTVPKVVAWWFVGNELAKLRGRDLYEMPWVADTRNELAKIGRIHRYDMSPEERQLYREEQLATDADKLPSLDESGGSVLGGVSGDGQEDRSWEDECRPG